MKERISPRPLSGGKKCFTCIFPPLPQGMDQDFRWKKSYKYSLKNLKERHIRRTYITVLYTVQYSTIHYSA
jgi:hypothetical protein